MGNWLSSGSANISDIEAGNSGNYSSTMDTRPTSSSSVDPIVIEDELGASSKTQSPDMSVFETGNKSSVVSKSRNEIQKRDEEIEYMKNQLSRLKKEKEELLLRLSSMAGAKLMENNPNITDLSDENRPTKLAEQYSQLYDNEWTDVFTVLENNCKKSEKEAIFILRDFFVETYKFCSRWAKEKLENVGDVVSDFEGSKEPPKEVMKILKDNRKRNYKTFLKTLRKTGKQECVTLMSKTDMKENKLTDEQKESFKVFRKKCYEMCLLMTIQDPPVYVEVDVEKQQSKFDKNLYKEYTSSGSEILFVVWPTLYLHVDGPVLAKGTAQGRNPKRAQQQTEITPQDDRKKPRYANDGNESEDANKAKQEDKVDNDSEKDFKNCQPSCKPVNIKPQVHGSKSNKGEASGKTANRKMTRSQKQTK